jgi:hypothetical protein
MEEHRLRVPENRVLRRTFELKRCKVKGEWRKLHNKELRDSNPSPNIVRILKSNGIKSAGHVAQMGKGRTHVVYWLESQRERSTRNTKAGSYRARTGWVMDWIFQAQDRGN